MAVDVAPAAHRHPSVRRQTTQTPQRHVRRGLTAALREVVRRRLGSIGGFWHAFVELDIERGVVRGFDVMVGAGNDRNAFSRRCMDSPRRVIDEQHRTVDHDEFGPCRCHMGFGQRRGDVGGVERGCSASWRGRSGNPWTVWRDEPKLRDQALANRSRIRRRSEIRSTTCAAGDNLVLCRRRAPPKRHESADARHQRPGPSARDRAPIA